MEGEYTPSGVIDSKVDDKSQNEVLTNKYEGSVGIWDLKEFNALLNKKDHTKIIETYDQYKKKKYKALDSLLEKNQITPWQHSINKMQIDTLGDVLGVRREIDQDTNPLVGLVVFMMGHSQEKCDYNSEHNYTGFNGDATHFNVDHRFRQQRHFPELFQAAAQLFTKATKGDRELIEKTVNEYIDTIGVKTYVKDSISLSMADLMNYAFEAGLQEGKDSAQAFIDIACINQENGNRLSTPKTVDRGRSHASLSTRFLTPHIANLYSYWRGEIQETPDRLLSKEDISRWYSETRALGAMKRELDTVPKTNSVIVSQVFQEGQARDWSVNEQNNMVNARQSSVAASEHGIKVRADRLLGERNGLPRLIAEQVKQFSKEAFHTTSAIEFADDIDSILRTSLQDPALSETAKGTLARVINEGSVIKHLKILQSDPLVSWLYELKSRPSLVKTLKEHSQDTNIEDIKLMMKAVTYKVLTLAGSTEAIDYMLNLTKGSNPNKSMLPDAAAKQGIEKVTKNKVAKGLAPVPAAGYERSVKLLANFELARSKQAERDDSSKDLQKEAAYQAFLAIDPNEERYSANLRLYEMNDWEQFKYFFKQNPKLFLQTTGITAAAAVGVAALGIYGIEKYFDYKYGPASEARVKETVTPNLADINQATPVPESYFQRDSQNTQVALLDATATTIGVPEVTSIPTSETRVTLTTVTAGIAPSPETAPTAHTIPGVAIENKDQIPTTVALPSPEVTPTTLASSTSSSSREYVRPAFSTPEAATKTTEAPKPLAESKEGDQQPVILGEVLHIPESETRINERMLPDSITIHSSSDFLQKARERVGPFEQIERTALLDTKAMQFTENQFAYTLPEGTNVVYPFDGYKIVKIVQQGGGTPSLTRLGSIEYDENQAPEKIVVIAERNDEKDSPESFLQVVNSDPELAYTPDVNKIDATRLTIALGNDPKLRDIVKRYASIMNSAVGTFINEELSYTILNNNAALEEYLKVRGYDEKFVPSPSTLTEYRTLEALANQPGEGIYCQTSTAAAIEFNQVVGVNTLDVRGRFYQIVKGKLVMAMAHARSEIILPDGTRFRADMQPPMTSEQISELGRNSAAVMDKVPDTLEEIPDSLQEEQAVNEPSPTVPVPMIEGIKSSEHRRQIAKEQLEAINHNAEENDLLPIALFYTAIAARRLYPHLKSRFVREKAVEGLALADQPRLKSEEKKQKRKENRERIDNEKTEISNEEQQPIREIKEKEIVIYDDKFNPLEQLLLGMMMYDISTNPDYPRNSDYMAKRLRTYFNFFNKADEETEKTVLKMANEMSTQQLNDQQIQTHLEDEDLYHIAELISIRNQIEQMGACLEALSMTREQLEIRQSGNSQRIQTLREMLGLYDYKKGKGAKFFRSLRKTLLGEEIA